MLLLVTCGAALSRPSRPADATTYIINVTSRRKYDGSSIYSHHYALLYIKIKKSKKSADENLLHHIYADVYVEKRRGHPLSIHAGDNITAPPHTLHTHNARRPWLMQAHVFTACH